jgi:Zn-dependent peptidase ImmA (M78 family)
VLHDLDSGAEIIRHTEKLLRVAEVSNHLPTPVNNIVEAARLTEAEESWLSESSLAGVPEHLAKKMRRMKGRIHAALDRKTREIHIDPSIEHDGRRRFKTLHEVTHEILPWQEELGYADNGATLSWMTHIEFEQEANQGGAELLFQRELFQTMADDYQVRFASIIDLAGQFGASIHASFRRYVETHKRPMAGLVLDKSPCQIDPVGYKRNEAISSVAWSERYDHPSTWPRVICGQPYTFIDDIRTLNGFLAPKPTMRYPNLNNEPTELRVELFSNYYKVFVLLWMPRRELFKRKRIIVPASARI